MSARQVPELSSVRTFRDLVHDVARWPRSGSEFRHPEQTTEMTCCIVELLSSEIISGYRHRQPTQNENRAVHALYRAFDHLWDSGLKAPGWRRRSF